MTRAKLLTVALFAACSLWCAAAAEEGAPATQPSAVLPPVPCERLYLAFSDVLAVETAASEDGTPMVQEVWRRKLGAQVKDLVVSADGSRLYAATGAGVLVLDARDGKEVQRLGSAPSRRVLLEADGAIGVLEYDAGGPFRYVRHDNGGKEQFRFGLPGAVDDVARAPGVLKDRPHDWLWLLDIHARQVRLVSATTGEPGSTVDLESKTRSTHTLLNRMQMLPAGGSAEKPTSACLVTEYGRDARAYTIWADPAVPPQIVELGGTTETRALLLDAKSERVLLFGPTGVVILPLFSEDEPERHEFELSFQGAAFSSDESYVYLAVPHIPKLESGAILVYQPATSRIVSRLRVTGMSPYQIVAAPLPPAPATSSDPGAK